MREKTASGKNFKAALVYDKDGIKITTYQRVTGFPDYCISNKNIMLQKKSHSLRLKKSRLTKSGLIPPTQI